MRIIIVMKMGNVDVWYRVLYIISVNKIVSLINVIAEYTFKNNE